MPAVDGSLKKHCQVAAFRSELRPCAVYLHKMHRKLSLPQGGMRTSMSKA